MLRSIAAVAAGYFIFAASAVLLFQLSGRAPHADAPVAFKAAAIVWGAVFAMVGGYLAAHVSVRRPAAHGAAVALVIAAGAIASIVARPSDPVWSQIGAVVVMAPCAWVGSVIAARQRGSAAMRP
jgi:hypothetical protein